MSALIALRLIASIASEDGFYWDFANFYNTGERAWHGEHANIYRTKSTINGHRPHGSARFEYTGFPLSAFAFAPLGAFAPRTAIGVFKAACAVCFGLGYWVLLQRLRRDRWLRHNQSLLRDPKLKAPHPHPGLTLVFLLGVLACEPAWFALRVGGQSTAMSFALLALFALAYSEERPLTAALCLSVAMLFKPFFALSAVLFVLAWDTRFVSRLIACLAVEGGLSLLIFGLEPHLEWLQILQKESVRWAVPWWNNASLPALFSNFWIYLGGAKYGLTAPPSALSGCLIAYKLAVGALYVGLVRQTLRSPAPSAERRNRLAALAIMLPLFFSTVVWPHYLVFLLIPLAFAARRWHDLDLLHRIGLVLIPLALLRSNEVVTHWIGEWLEVDSIAGCLAASLYGSAALVISLLLFVVSSKSLLSSPRSTPTDALR